MGSLVVKLDKETNAKLENRFFYSDIDMFTMSSDIDGDTPILYDVEAVKQSVRNILMWRVGESILHPEFGHNIHQSMYNQMDEVSQSNAVLEIKRALEENEERIEVKDIYISKNDDGNALTVHVSYAVKGNKVGQANIVEESVIQGK